MTYMTIAIVAGFVLDLIFRGSKMAVSSGEADRASDIRNRKNYQKLSAGRKDRGTHRWRILVLVVVTVSTGVQQ